MSELLKRAIETLSVVVNVSTGLAHPLDESRAKELFKALHADGESLAYDEIKKLAVDNQPVGCGEERTASFAIDAVRYRSPHPTSDLRILPR